MTAQIWNDRGWTTETDKDVLKNKYTEILKKSGFHILDFSEYVFNPQGYTAIWLLSESHFAIHTFPEFGKSYYEISSCNKEYFKTFIDLNTL